MESPDGQVVEDGTEELSIASDPKFVSELALAEYKTLRDEILKKMDHRTSLVVCSVTVSSAVLGFGVDRKSGPLLLVSPLVSLLLGIFILFHNTQIGTASEYLRVRFDEPLSKSSGGSLGWHIGMSDPKVRLRHRLLPYHIPLILIAIAPALVAFPLALANLDWVVWLLMGVDGGLLVLYAAQLTKYWDRV
ncbi:hypothetical protein [Lentzea sp.]|uniref:hypothetical protein n=1 Tax=Lentzea sp. TaxID=56099 RepID=UPI002CC2270F|nr:hypothetical protein [Lentzea sp.]HUQ56547.1 hypothetical protein [Lentzea sp.]